MPIVLDLIDRYKRRSIYTTKCLRAALSKSAQQITSRKRARVCAKFDWFSQCHKKNLACNNGEIFHL